MTRLIRLALALLVLAAISSEAATPEPSVGAPEDLVLTIYSDGVALVREQRRVVLRRGVNRVTVSRLPAGMDSTSLRVEATGVVLLEVLDSQNSAPAGGSKPAHPFREDSLHEDSLAHAIPSSPASVAPGSDYTTEWVLEAKQATDQYITVSYLARTVKYSANLDIVLDTSGRALLEGWVSIENHAGLTFENAQVVLVTSPTREPRPARRLAPAQVRREVEMPDRVTLPAGQRRRVRVFSRWADLGPERIVVRGGRLEEHQILLDPDSLMNRADLGSGRIRAERLRRLGAEDIGALAHALPPLVRRIYSKDAGGSTLLAEAAVDPARMLADLPLGDSADIQVSRRQLSFKRRESGSIEETNGNRRCKLQDPADSGRDLLPSLSKRRFRDRGIESSDLTSRGTRWAGRYGHPLRSDR